MKIICFFVLIFGSTISRAQVDTINYLVYHKKIVEIEETYVSEDFEKADSLYTSLFCKYNPPFLSDIVTALQISVMANNFDHSKQLLELSVLKGAKPECLKELAVLQKIPKVYWDNIDKKYPLLRKQYFNSIDSVLNRAFARRFEKEQRLKMSHEKNDIFQQNADHIYRIIKLKGNFPGEKMIGINMSGLKNYGKCSFVSSTAVVSLLHYSFGFSEFEKYYQKAMETGYLHPRDFADIYTFEYDKRKKRTFLYAKNTTVNWPVFPKYRFNFLYGPKIWDMEKVNADRAKFGICSYETDRKKLALEKKYGLKLRFQAY